MRRKSTFLMITFLVSFFLTGAQSVRDELTADFGPPAEANVWEKFVIPITPESFNVDEATLTAALNNITSFWIRTEMHTGYDVGGIDDVMIGSFFLSIFNTSSDGWSSGGDGTMEWIPTGGIEGGFLQISDWATGDWHWLIAPSTWAGDWSDLFGQNIEFWYKTDKPSYAAIIKLTTEPVQRLVINTPVNSYVPLNDSTMMQLEVLPVPDMDITVSFSTSDNQCITVPQSVLIPAGHSTAYVYFAAAADATDSCISVIEVTSPGYLSSRITMKVEDHTGILEPAYLHYITLFPNPSKGKFSITNTSGKSIDRIIMYDILANIVLDQQNKDSELIDIDVSDQPSGVYFLKLLVQDEVLTLKMVIE